MPPQRYARQPIFLHCAPWASVARALASIAAVAQVELKTRPEDEELGTKIVIAGSQVESQEVVSCPRGSNFSINNLFFNIPGAS